MHDRGRAEKRGIEIRYGTRALKRSVRRHARRRACACGTTASFARSHAKSVVLACGGFEANAEWRTRYLGPGWDLAKVRGTRFNTGDGIRMALDIGAAPVRQLVGLPCRADGT